MPGDRPLPGFHSEHVDFAQVVVDRGNSGTPPGCRPPQHEGLDPVAVLKATTCSNRTIVPRPCYFLVLAPVSGGFTISPHRGCGVNWLILHALH